MKCSAKDCPRDVYWEPTGLCLAHEKKRRAREATKATKTTAEALPDIIDWFRENGYEFCTIDQMPPQPPSGGGGGGGGG